ncbi:MAG: helix-turn-helix domain-containing protein [Candidatus Paceibacterota bacterium]
MSTAQIKIKNNTYLSLKEAAKRVPYTRDYLAKLARDKKVLSVQVGRQWFIEPDSLSKFIERVNLEQINRKHKLRSERKREMFISQKMTELKNKVHYEKK